MQGRINKIIAGFYDIEHAKKIYRVRGSGKLRMLKIVPIVGDFVEFDANGFLTKVYPRKNMLVRPKVANIDQVLIVMSLSQPDFSDFLLDKYLAIVESRNIKPIIIFTKHDLKPLTNHKKDYESQGYKVFEINNLKFNNENLKAIIKNKISVFMGQSGVGKSSLINNLTHLNLKTQTISQALNRGKHTTRVVEMFDYNGGKIIDTPGFSSIDFDLTKQALAQSYHDFKKISQKCQFYKNCLHFHEKKCEIKTQVDKGKILKSRYQNYLKLLKEAK